jgi:hypothetical protein
MIRRSQAQTKTESPEAQIRKLEERGYELLEECRIRCECLSAAGFDSPELRAVHRRLGLAGYHASTWIACGARQQCLALAHERAAGGDGGQATITIDGPHKALRKLELQVERAAEAVTEALEATAVADHAHLAHLAILEARDSLRTPLISRGPGGGHATGYNSTKSG